MIGKWLRARQTKYTAYVTAYIAVVLAALVAINWLGTRHHKQWDTTANKRYTFAEQTINIVQGLKQDVTVYYFDDRFERAKELLDRYDELSPKLNVEYIDPEKKPDRANAAGYRPDGGSIVLRSGDARQEASTLSEEEVTSAIIRLLKGKERKVCFAAGGGEPALDDRGRNGYLGARTVIERSTYKTETITLLEKPDIPKDCMVLVVAGPRTEYPQAVTDAIARYVEAGGRALIALETPVSRADVPSVEQKALNAQLEKWGVIMKKDLVIDLSGAGQRLGLGPDVAFVYQYENHPIARGLKNVATFFPLSQGLDVKNADKINVQKLFSSMPQSVSATNTKQLEADITKLPPGPFALAAAGTYNTGNKAQEGRFVVVGSARFANNSYLGQSGNINLFLNMLNWLSSDEELISIRPKDPDDRRLTVTGKQLGTIFYSTLLFFPLAIVAAGVAVWWRRR